MGQQDPRGFYGQRKSVKNPKIRKSQGKIKGSGKIKVPKCKSQQRCRKNFELFYAECVQQFTNFFLLTALADYLYLHFKICSTAFVSSAIESQHWYFW